MSQAPSESLVEMLSKVLAQAKRGEISSAVLLTMIGRDGHIGYSTRITTADDAEAAPNNMQQLERHVTSLPATAE